ncbi:MAG: transporter substrate-binding domain-containing protein [Cytophagaceae bacterium]|nr:MAG: transporter substrate-binding domain-containing protein [Cytophagaceae bacterium]
MSTWFRFMRMMRVTGSLLLLFMVEPAITAPDEKPIPPRIVYADDYEYAPHSVRDSKGRASGFNIDLIRAIGKELGIQIDVRLMTWDYR